MRIVSVLMILVASSLEVFARSPVWITPQLGGMLDAKDSPAPDNAFVTDILLRGQQPFNYTEEEQDKLAHDPQLLLILRRSMEVSICNSLDAFRFGSEKQIALMKYVRAEMEIGLGDNEELKKKLIPDFPVGCRRPTPGKSLHTNSPIAPTKYDRRWIPGCFDSG